MDKVTANVQKFLKEHSLNEKKVLVAFSGGFDSMCLLDIVHKLHLNPIAIHLNHNWRGEESLQEEENCRQFCHDRGIEFYSEKLSSNIKPTETEARNARYEFFERCAKNFGSKAILTAHNADDNAETLIYRIAKGTGIDGLKGIASCRDIYYRPLLTTYRKDIEQYCKENNLSPNSDSSNQNTKYKRNLIRQNILPQLEKINDYAKIAINNLSENATADAEIINEYLATLQDKFKTQNFINYSKAVQNRIIYAFLLDNNFEYDKKRVEKIIEFIKENAKSKCGKTLSITDGKWLFVSENEIRLINAADKPQTPKFIIENCTIKPDKFPPDSEFKVYVNLTEVNLEELELRHRHEGDLIQPLGCAGTQKLKKYLNGKAIPKDKRDTMLFLCQGSEVLWATGIGISEKIKVKNNPTHILRLERIYEQ